MKLRGNKTPVFSCIQPLGTPQIAVFFLFCVRFWHFLVFVVEESKQKNSKQKNSKHSKRVPACGFCAVQVPCPNSQNCLLGYPRPL